MNPLGDPVSPPLQLTELGRRRSLAIYTIFARPDDHPAVPYVVREFIVLSRSEPMPSTWMQLVYGSLEEARQAVPPGADFRIPRSEGDVACIVETWL